MNSLKKAFVITLMISMCLCTVFSYADGTDEMQETADSCQENAAIGEVIEDLSEVFDPGSQDEIQETIPESLDQNNDQELGSEQSSDSNEKEDIAEDDLETTTEGIKEEDAIEQDAQEEINPETYITAEDTELPSADTINGENDEDADLGLAAAESDTATVKNGFYYVNSQWKWYKNGKLQTSMTGIIKGTINGATKWYYIKNGVFTKATCIALKADGSSKLKYYVKNGTFNTYTGTVTISGKKYKLVKGVVK